MATKGPGTLGRQRLLSRRNAGRRTTTPRRPRRSHMTKTTRNTAIRAGTSSLRNRRPRVGRIRPSLRGTGSNPPKRLPAGPLKVALVDGAETMGPPILSALRQALGRQVTRSSLAGANVLIYSLFGKTHQRASRMHTILLCGEPTVVTQRRHDLLVDCKTQSSGKSIYYPFAAWSFCERRQNNPRNLLNTPRYQKSRFCCFMYSRPSPFRDAFFTALNARKHVDALGSVKHNVPATTDRKRYDGAATYMDTAVQKYKPYRFVICMENSSKPGYVTEKIVNGMLAGCIPIYWGAPDVVKLFNPEAIIRVTGAADMQKAIQQVLHLEQNPAEYRQMLERPWFRNNALPECFQSDFLTKAFRRYYARM